MKKVAILGFGAFGQALAHVLEAKQGLVIAGYDPQPLNHPLWVETMGEAVEDADLIIFAIPSAFFEDALARCPKPKEGAVLMTGTKGMDPKTAKLPFELLQEHFSEYPVAVLSGPMLAHELQENKHTEATIATQDERALQALLDVFTGTIVTLKPSADLLGTALLGVLKNVYVLALGACAGLELGTQASDRLVAQAKTEMHMILERLGANKQTVEEPAGMPDFIATGSSPASRNYQYGFGTATGNIPEGLTAEGVKNISQVITRVGSSEQFPLLHAIEQIFLHEASVRSTLVPLTT